MKKSKFTESQIIGILKQQEQGRTAALNTLISQIASATPGVVVDGAGYSSSTSSFPWAGLLGNGRGTSGPKAYLNWLIFDRSFNFITGGFSRMSASPKETGSDVAHELLTSGDIPITQAGYVYIYLSNEETTPLEVYFDDFTVKQTKSAVVQMDDYYPFGLAFNSYSRENSVPNRWKFQKQEHIDDLGLDWDSFKWRNYQPEIGRFFNIDPLAEKYVYNSTYAFAENMVITFRELEGLEGAHYQNDEQWKKDNEKWVKDELAANGFDVAGTHSQSSSSKDNSKKKEDKENKKSKDSNTNSTDLMLAGVGTSALVAETQSGIIASDRTGVTSGKFSPTSPKIYSKVNAARISFTAKGVGFGLTLWGFVNNERQYRNGEIGATRRSYNNLNNAVGAVVPILGLPIAAGDYVGQKYSKEIVNDMSSPGGFIFEGMKSFLEFVGVPTGPPPKN